MRSFEGKYNPYAALSTALITVQQATRSSPEQALLFHDGSYVGTATSKPYGLVSLTRPVGATIQSVVAVRGDVSSREGKHLAAA